jgi:thioesterase domain-containing protein
MLRTAIGTSDVLRRHQPTVFEGDLVFFTAVEDDPTGTRLADLWRPFVSGDVRNHAVEATHWRMTTVAALATIGPIVDASLEPSSTSSPGNIGSKVGTNLASR